MPLKNEVLRCEHCGEQHQCCLSTEQAIAQWQCPKCGKYCQTILDHAMYYKLFHLMEPVNTS